jgi:hypothetical protein
MDSTKQLARRAGLLDLLMGGELPIIFWLAIWGARERTS